jgi:hypothetical protein
MLRTPDGTYRIRGVTVLDQQGRRRVRLRVEHRMDGEWRQLADCRTVEEVAQHVDLGAVVQAAASSLITAV